jgi:hypothetical protein
LPTPGRYILLSTSIKYLRDIKKWLSRYEFIVKSQSG